MPEIVTCTKCGKETYQGRASCPHCGGWLLDHPFSALAPDKPDVPDHPSFLALHQSTAYRLRIDYDTLDLDRLMEAANVTGFKRTTMRAARTLDPIIGNFIMIIGGNRMTARVERDLSRHFMRKSRAAAVARAMVTSVAYYEHGVGSGTVVVEVL